MTSYEVTSEEEDLTFKGFAHLGYDVMWNIAQYCMDIKSIIYLGSTCKIIKYQLDDDENVWAPIAINRGLVTQQKVEERRRISEYAYDYVPWRSIVRKALCDARASLWNDIINEDNVFKGAPSAFNIPIWDQETNKRSEEIRTSLRRLGTLDNTGGMCVGKSGIWAVASALRHATTLDTLRLRNQLIRNHGAQLLSLAACPSANIRCVPKEYEKRLGAAINTAPSDLRVCIQRCFSASSSAMSSVALGFGQSLSILTLDGNKIEGKEGGEAIASLIVNCPQLAILNIARNAIDKDGCVLIAKSIETHGASLSRCFLDENPIGDKGAEAVISAFATQFSNRSSEQNRSGLSFRWLLGTPFVLSMKGCKLTHIPTAIAKFRQAVRTLSETIISMKIKATPLSNAENKPKEQLSQTRCVYISLGNATNTSQTERNTFVVAEKQAVITQSEDSKKDKLPFYVHVDVSTADDSSAVPVKEDKGCNCM